MALPVCRYEPGQRFNRHYDDSADMGDGLKTAYTLLVYLSGQEHGMQGGETVFYSHGRHGPGASLPHLYSQQPSHGQHSVISIKCQTYMDGQTGRGALMCRKEEQDGCKRDARDRVGAPAPAWGRLPAA